MDHLTPEAAQFVRRDAGRIDAKALDLAIEASSMLIATLRPTEEEGLDHLRQSALEAAREAARCLTLASQALRRVETLAHQRACEAL